MATKIERLVAAGLISEEEAQDETLINVVNYLAEEEIDQLIGIALKAVAFNDGECPPPLDSRSTSLRQRARARARKRDKRNKK